MAPEDIVNDETGRIVLYPNWASEPDVLFKQLIEDVVWKTRTIRLFGKTSTIPRQEAWVGDAGVQYKYSHQIYTTDPWPEVLEPIVNGLKEGVAPFNGALLNYYADGSDSMGWHSDDEPELGVNPSVAILSLGAQRDLRFRKKGNPKEAITVPLPKGSLLVMNGAIQHHWQHALPKRAKAAARISCTFRAVRMPFSP